MSLNTQKLYRENRLGMYKGKELSRDIIDNGSVYSYWKDGVGLLQCSCKTKVFEVPKSVKNDLGKEYDVVAIFPDAFTKVRINEIKFPADSRVLLLATKALEKNCPYCVVPASVKRIEFGFYNFENFQISPENPNFACSNQFAYSKYPFEVIFVDINARYLLFRQTITCLRPFTIRDCKNLKEIRFPASLKAVGTYCVTYCFNLVRISFQKDSKLEFIDASSFTNLSIRRIKLPSSLKEIGPSSFSENDQLVNVVFPNDTCIEKIGMNTFFSDNIKLRIPKRIRSIFGDNYPENLFVYNS